MVTTPIEKQVLVCEKLLGWKKADFRIRKIPPLTLDFWHKCWLKLTLEQKQKFIRLLLGYGPPYGIIDVMGVLDKSAEQRLDALVKTLP
jgi:hypothetical protein